jgi:deoxycytidine triphosphate deaminase
MTAPTIHSGFAGKVVLEMYNFGPYPILLKNKMRICQLIFEVLGEGPDLVQKTQYQGQVGLS